MTVTESRAELQRLILSRGDALYLDAQIRQEVARVARLVSTLEMDSDGNVWLTTVDPIDEDTEDVRLLGPIYSPGLWRKVPPELDDRLAELEADWESSETPERAEREWEYRRAKGY